MEQCGGMDDGAVWRHRRWSSVEAQTMEQCGGMDDGAVWRHRRWSSVEAWTMEQYGGMDSRHRLADRGTDKPMEHISD
jgi:hypothetical protein